MSLGCPQTKLFSQCVTFTALCKHHRHYNISSGSSYSLSLCLTSPEESDYGFLSNMDRAQRPWDFVNGGILLPTKCSVRFKPGGNVTREQPLYKHPGSLSCLGVLLGFLHPRALTGIPQHFAEDVSLVMKHRAGTATYIPLVFNSSAAGCGSPTLDLLHLPGTAGA